MNNVLAKPTTNGTGTAKRGIPTGAIAIAGANSDQFVNLSFRQAKGCKDATDSNKTNQSYVEAKSENHAVQPPQCTSILTQGDYDMHASVAAAFAATILIVRVIRKEWVNRSNRRKEFITYVSR